MSEQRLRNFYLPPFKAAVDAGADTAMCSFNAINGVPGCANPYTETDDPQGRWGFDGFIESDYTAVAELRACPGVNPDGGPCGHGVADDGPDAARAGAQRRHRLRDGLDQLPRLRRRSSSRSGRVSMSRIDDAVRRILRIKFRAGLFEHPYVDVAKAREQAAPAAANRAAARDGARGRSMVLLKNDGPVLPLDPTQVDRADRPARRRQPHDMLGPWWGRGDDEGRRLAVRRHARTQNPNTTYTPGCTISHNDLVRPGERVRDEAASRPP